jgi:hypothetical protein
MNSSASVRQIAPSDGLWTALHDQARVDGPAEITCGGDCLVREVTFQLDDFGADLVLSDRFRDFHKGGAALVEVSGHFPFGAEIGMAQTFRYGARHVRVVSDLKLRKGSTVRRQVGLGSLFLPGPWRRLYCIPSAQDLAEGKEARWRDLPAAPAVGATLAHWQHLPLALVFERPNGARLEIGAGSDLWRWEHHFGCKTGTSSYTVVAEEGGLRVRREPLLTDTELQPQPRVYRLTWHLAWQPAGAEAAPTSPEPQLVPVRFTAEGEALIREAVGAATCPALLLDLNQWPCLAQRRRAVSPAALRRDERAPSPCWESAGVQKALRRMIRQIAALGPHGVLTWRGLYPGPCWDPTHCERQGEPLPHWDLDALLGLCTWGRQQLGPGWQVRVEAPGWEMLPSVAGLFAPTGFAAPADEAPDA